ncbi:MAG: phosphotransferase [Archangium sp.]|nr:phosphotransferase [Archangium sp.]
MISKSVLRAHGLVLDVRASASLAPSRNPTCIARTRDGERVFIKSAVTGDPGVDVERAALSSLLEVRAPVPRVLISEPGLLAIEWIEGRTLFELRRRPGRGFPVDRAIGRALARVQRAGARSLSQRVPGDFASRAVWTTPEAYASASPAVLGLIRRVQSDGAAVKRLAWLLQNEAHVDRGAVHGDCRQPNVLVRGKSVTFIDWEASGLGDPARDIGMLMADDYRAWLAAETRTEWQPEKERERHFAGLLAGWEREWGGEHRERIWWWLAESLLRHEFARAHHLHVVKEHVVTAALELLRDSRA